MKQKVQNTAKYTNSNREKISIDERWFVQFIIALRQIKTSSSAAEVNVNHFEIGINVWRQYADRNTSKKELILSVFATYP